MRKRQLSSSWSGRAVVFGLATLAVTALLSCQKKEQDVKPGMWKLTMIKYEDLQQTTDAERGFREGLRQEGLVEGRDYTLSIRSAQGDQPTVLTLFDATKSDGTNMVVTLQTPTLYTAISRSAAVPLVFMVVANPYVITSIGTNDSAHLPNVTGVYTNTMFDGMLRMIRMCLPNVASVGTLVCSAELNAVHYQQQLRSAGIRAGLRVEAVGVTASDEIPMAAQALCARGVDAICQIEDNMTSAGFDGLVQIARRRNVPLFSFVNDQARRGSVLVYAPDYVQGAGDAARKAVRIMRGENPQMIPFSRIRKFDLIVNLDAAKAFGITVPDSIINAAQDVLPARP